LIAVATFHPPHYEADMELLEFELRPTHGLASGVTIQFAEGRWPEGVGEGVAMSERSFDLAEPCIDAACSEWTSGHRYGVFEISTSNRKLLVMLLRRESAKWLDSSNGSEQASVFLERLADWLEKRFDKPFVSILGY
jgi:hypothetical protein